MVLSLPAIQTLPITWLETTAAPASAPVRGGGGRGLMEAGRELDALVAEKVMGESVPDGYKRVGDHWEKEEPIFDDDGAYTRSWQIVEWPALYSEHIAAAWRVVERLRQGSKQTGIAACVGIQIYDACIPQDIECWIHSPMIARIEVFAETAPLAICLAALEAVGENS